MSQPKPVLDVNSNYVTLELHKTVLALALKFRSGRRSDSRYRAVLQLAAIVWLVLPRAALTDSLARGYIYFTPQQPVKGVLNVGASPTRRIKRFTTEQPDA
ncbi:MAG TPA: hypothetical protein VH280_25155, partial [Verrucomicrobiae bacterium]|nr:hypothetical protein [Verrucomicrobiae bacterium]